MTGSGTTNEVVPKNRCPSTVFFCVGWKKLLFCVERCFHCSPKLCYIPPLNPLKIIGKMAVYHA